VQVFRGKTLRKKRKAISFCQALERKGLTAEAELHEDDEEDLEELVTKHLEEQLNVSSEEERLVKGKQSKTKST